MRRGSFYDDFPATSLLLVTCLAFYAIEVVYQHKASERELLESAWMIHPKITYSLGSNHLPSILERGEVWRLVVSAFLHGFLLHIFMNGLVLVDLGRICEPLLGTARFTVVYMASAVGASLASAGYSYFLDPGSTSVGASGALCGLIGLLLAFSLRHRDAHLRDQMVRWIAYIVLLSLLVGGIGISVDHFGHGGGLLTGAVFGFFTPRYVTSRSAARWRIPFWFVVALTALCLGLAIHYRVTTPLVPLDG